MMLSTLVARSIVNGHHHLRWKTVRATLSTGSGCMARFGQLRVPSSFTKLHAIRSLLPFPARLPSAIPFSWRLHLARLGASSVAIYCLPLSRLFCGSGRNTTTTIRRSAVVPRENEPEFRLSLFWRFLRPYLGWLALAVLCAILAAAVNIQSPLALGQLIDGLASVVASSDQSTSYAAIEAAQLRPIALRLLSLYAAQAALTFAYIASLTVLGERLAADMRLALFSSLLSRPMAFFDEQRTGELSGRLSADVQEFKSCFKSSVAQGLRTFAQLGGCVCSMWLLSPKMTAIVMCILPIVIGVGAGAGIILRSGSRKAHAQTSYANSLAFEALDQIRTVKTFAGEETETRSYGRETQRAAALHTWQGVGIGLFQAATTVFLNGIVLGVLYGGSSLIAGGELSAGGLMSFLVAAQQVQRSLSQLSLVFGQVVRGWTAGGRVFEWIDGADHAETSRDGGVCLIKVRGHVRFDDVWFEYPNRAGQPVLRGLSLDVQPGQTVALCGRSGQGKSTLVWLLERLYEPSSGRVLIDGLDLRDADVHWLRGQVIGLISQEPVLFATTIEENIRYGNLSATHAEVVEAAQAANAHEFIEQFPDKYSTQVGERGAQLSGGQKQRIAIARALLKRPAILILDEATSALDSSSEAQVREAIQRAAVGRTVIVIAHRLSTIQTADQIVVLNAGQIAEKGTHEELIKKRALYYKLTQSHNHDQ